MGLELYIDRDLLPQPLRELQAKDNPLFVKMEGTSYLKLVFYNAQLTTRFLDGDQDVYIHDPCILL